MFSIYLKPGTDRLRVVLTMLIVGIETLSFRRERMYRRGIMNRLPGTATNKSGI